MCVTDPILEIGATFLLADDGLAQSRAVWSARLLDLGKVILMRRQDRETLIEIALRRLPGRELLKPRDIDFR